MSRLHLLRSPVLTVAAVTVAAWAILPRPAAAADALGPIDEPVSADLLARLEKVAAQGLQQMPQLPAVPLKPIGDTTPPAELGADGTPVVLYVGADFCPYCAVLRWPLALTLMRFGELSGVRYTRSSGTDVFPNTATFSFNTTRLQSDYVDFQAVEVRDREGKPLQTPTDSQRQIFARYDTMPYTKYPGSIPFLYIDGQYIENGSPFTPQPFKGLNWDQVVAQLEAGDNPVWQTVIAETNLLTAAVCAVTNQQPGEVCSAPAIKDATAKLPH